MIAAVLIAALLVAPAPSRGDSDVPLVHVSGWYHLGPASLYGDTSMREAPAEQNVAFTLPAGSFVDVYFGGTCRMDGGPLLTSTRLSRVTCHGSGGA